jgi:hypothetical protein
VKLESDLEDLLDEDEIAHEEIPTGIKETGHPFINDLIKAASDGGMEEKNVRKVTSKLKLLYSKLERENNMLEQIRAHKTRYREQSNDREDKLVKFKEDRRGSKDNEPPTPNTHHRRRQPNRANNIERAGRKQHGTRRDDTEPDQRCDEPRRR